MSIRELQDSCALCRARIDCCSVVEGLDAWVEKRDRAGVVCSPDVAKDADGLVCAPEEAAGHECKEQEDTVDKLEGGAGERELVAEPVDVEEGRGELVEDERWCVEVHEGSLMIH